MDGDNTMHPNFGARPTNQYLVQRINGATPEQLVVILLEGAQKFLMQAIAATRMRDIQTKARMVNKVSAIIEELTLRLDLDEGGELVGNLASIYEWWLRELFSGSQKNQPERLESIVFQMAEMRVTWDRAIQSQVASMPSMQLTAEGLVG
jgi:flagellar protein FliS